jgi:hypothetical protein
MVALVDKHTVQRTFGSLLNGVCYSIPWTVATILSYPSAFCLGFCGAISSLFQPCVTVATWPAPAAVVLDRGADAGSGSTADSCKYHTKLLY